MKLSVSPELIPMGYQALIDQFSIKCLPHYRQTYLTLTGRGYSESKPGQPELVVFPKAYALEQNQNPLQQLEFAIKYEGINLEIVSVIFQKISAAEVTEYILSTPTGKYCRIIWFLYEFLVQANLPLEDLKQVPYIDLLDSKKYYVGTSIKSKRHGINNNLLGNREFSPVVRKTELLERYEAKQFSDITEKMIQHIDPQVLQRAIQFLYTKEARSSFAIEKIKPSLQRTEKFTRVLEQASKIPQLGKDILIELQNSIVEEAYRDRDFRASQNYVGELTSLYTEKIHYISPKPQDLPELMQHYFYMKKDCYPLLFTLL